MGSKSSGAPPPDPRLVDRQMRSMDVQDSAMTRMMGLAEEFAPLQREQLQFGLDSARTAYDQSQSDRDWTLGRRQLLTRAQNSVFNDASNFDLEGRTNTLRGQAMADVSRGFGDARAAGSRQLERMGINPNSGRYAAAMADLAPQQALVRAQAGNLARSAARAEGLQLTDRAVNSLSGYPAMGMQATGMGAGYGASGIGMANAGVGGMASGYGGAANVAGGMGQNAAGMYNAMGNYKNAQDQIAATSDPFNTVLGAATGVGMSWATGRFLPGMGTQRQNGTKTG